MIAIWGRYVSVLVELTRMEGTKHGQMIANQMLDVAIRVQAVRPFTVAQMVRRHYHIHLRTCTYVTVCTITATPRTAYRTCALFVGQALLLENAHVLANNSQRNGICEVLYAAAWICGEFSQ